MSNTNTSTNTTENFNLLHWDQIKMEPADIKYLGQLVEALKNTGMQTDLAEEILIRRIPVNYSVLVFRGKHNRITEILFTRNPSVKELFSSLSLSEFLEASVERVSPSDREIIEKSIRLKNRLINFNKDDYLELIWDNPDYAAERLYVLELLVAQRKITPEHITDAIKELRAGK